MALPSWRTNQKGGRFVSAHDTLFRLTVMIIVLEPLRCLTHYFMHHSRSVKQPAEWPPLCSLASHSRSLVSAVLQYYSWLLCGAGMRLRLLWQRECASFEEWASDERYSEQLLLLRTAICFASAMVRRRHLRKYHSYPWRLAALVDTRLPQSERWSIGEEFLGTKMLLPRPIHECSFA